MADLASPVVIDASEGAPSGLAPAGLGLARRFTRPGEDPYERVEWVRREAVIRDAAGGEVFRQPAVEVPAAWSDIATRVVASKYLRGALGSREREDSVRQLVSRVVGTIAAWAREDGYLAGGDEAATFAAELAFLTLDQRAAFNSPVWFNVGVEARPQCSACFINGVEDSLESILALARNEAMLFKFGSGSGTNLSSLRASTEPLSNGGVASGPLSFMRGLDAFAGAIKSGGRTRRAARMVILDVAHPDVVAFIRAKATEEAKARALVAAGYDPGFDAPGGAYDSVAFQNANHSLRLSDAFLDAVVADDAWMTRLVADGKPAATYRARDLLREMAAAAWACGDPGIQLDGTIQRWHTCPAGGRIRASNPCSEFLFLDDSACNLASLNLLRFWSREGDFDAGGFAAACALLVTAQDVLVDRASYPTARIGELSRRYRPLGLGFANLGGLLMASGRPYDSEPGRALAAAVTALMTGAAYRQSARLAAARGPFAAYRDNATAMKAVLAAHREAAAAIDSRTLPPGLHEAALAAWDEALALGAAHGFRNAQATCLAPTGTIAFMMDCDTTGVEPELALAKTKQLVGGGSLRIVNRTVPLALASLGYEEREAATLLAWLEERGTVEGAPGLDPAHLPVFDSALPASPGGRRIAPRGHLLMLAALQPLVSGAISKTINVPHDTSVEAIEAIFLDAWRLGLKAVTVYRDGCKQSQPVRAGRERPAARATLPTVATPGAAAPAPAAPSPAASSPAFPALVAQPAATPTRRRLPDERRAITHKFSVQGHEGYVTAGLYDDGEPGEIFLVMAKEGSTVSGLMDAVATTVSIALQHGVPLATLVEKLAHTRYEPSGFTRHPAIPYAKSLTDYVFRWLGWKFLPASQRQALGLIEGGGESGAAPPMLAAPLPFPDDAPACPACGTMMTRSGSCYRCGNCGATSGCG